MDSLPQRLPRLRLGTFPTAVETLAGLAPLEKLSLFVKRDDQAGPVGGSKVRKAEWFIAQALRKGCKRLVTIGAIRSNHLRATAYYAAQYGLEVAAVVVMDREHSPASLEDLTRLGVDVHAVQHKALVPATVAVLLGRSSQSLYVPPGGSSAYGNLAFVEAALELRGQIETGRLPEPEAIYFPLGSGGIAAGLAVGCALADLRARLIGVRVVERWMCNAVTLRLLVERTSRLLASLGVSAPPPRPVELVHDQAGRGYAFPTAAGHEATDLLAPKGLTLDGTYSAKAMAALIANARRGFHSGQNVLFWMTYRR